MISQEDYGMLSVIGGNAYSFVRKMLCFDRDKAGLWGVGGLWM